VGKIFISIPVGLRRGVFPLSVRQTAFWIIFVTLMLPVEVRIYPTYKVVGGPAHADTYAGLILPADCVGDGTLLFRQFFK